MAQLQWTVPGFGGRNYRVGMYHGEKSGHLVVHCNNKVMLIDFGVKDSKNYSFFLDQELFELHLKRNNDSFSYDLRHNEDVDSPHNRRRKQDQKALRWRLIAVGILFIIFAIVGISVWLNNPVTQQELRHQLAAGRGTSTEVSLFLSQDEWQASYRVEDQIHSVRVGSINAIQDRGLRLTPGDRFTARYNPDRPHLLYIDWQHPTSETLERFQQQVMIVHASQHPELSPQQIGCQVRLAYSIAGMDGLGHLMGQQQEATSKYNRNSYLRMIRSTEFRNSNKACL